MNLKINTDGGSRGNPGLAAIGVVAVDNQENIVFEISENIGIKTNNEAEYLAVVAALKKIIDLKNNAKTLQTLQIVEFFLDSKLVVEQLSRKWKIKEDRLREFAQECWKLIAEISLPVSFTHVERAKNKHADMLVNRALDSL